MFEFIGMMAGGYSPFPFLRRLARGQGTSRDFGKYTVMTAIAGFVIVPLLKKYRQNILDAALSNEPPEKLIPLRDWLKGFSVAKKIVSEEMGKTHQVIQTAETFEKRFGTLHAGDTVIFNTDINNIEGWFLDYTHEGNLLVQCYTGEEDASTERITVMLGDVLDVIPKF